MNRFHRWNRQHLFAGVLTLALLFVQSLGLLHAVAHSGDQQPGHSLLAGQPQPGVGMQAGPGTVPAALPANQNWPDSPFDALHSCVSFDAATLAAAVHVKAFASLLPVNVDRPASVPAPVSHEAPACVHFLSRAPPSRLS